MATLATVKKTAAATVLHEVNYIMSNTQYTQSPKHYIFKLLLRPFIYIMVLRLYRLRFLGFIQSDINLSIDCSN